MIIPAHNRGELAARAVASVLVQEPAPAEVIVVDDASSDGTEELLNSRFGSAITVLRSDSNIERAAARNLGARQARGELLAFLDSDDEWAPGKLAAQFETASTGRPCVTGLAYIDAESNPTGETYVPPSDGEVAVKLGNPYRGIASSVLVPREMFAAVGGFPEPRQLQGSEDWLFALRLVTRGHPIEVVGGALTRYRMHEGNWMADPAAVSESIWAAIEWVGNEGLLTDREMRRLRGSLARQLARLNGRAHRYGDAWRWTARSLASGTLRQAPATLALSAKSAASGVVSGQRARSRSR